MATTVNFKRILEPKQWEFCAPLDTAITINYSAGPTSFWSAKDFKGNVFFNGATGGGGPAFAMYNAKEDGWILMRNPTGVTNATGNSTTSIPHNVSVEYSATGGSINTIVTTLRLARNLNGYKLMITDGPGAGDVREISTNTIGTNDTITVTENFSAVITSQTKFKLFTPRLFFMSAFSGDYNFVGSFQEYDFAQNRWFTLAALGTITTADSRLFSTCSYRYGEYVSLATGTSTGDNFADTINNTTKNWTVNQWTNYQIRITSGTGAGQIRTISSNTATRITVSEKWRVIPDYTSVYAIDGNDDFLYFFPYGSTNVFRYRRSTNTWTAMNPSPARTSGFSGAGGAWIDGVTDTNWTNENNIINGRRILYFQGQSPSDGELQYYDIPSNSFTTLTSNFNPRITFATQYEYDGENALYMQPTFFTGTTDIIHKLNIPNLTADQFGKIPYSNQVNPANNIKCMFVHEFNDGGTKLKYLYSGFTISSSTPNPLFRVLII
jgi:hypothetical protein